MIDIIIDIDIGIVLVLIIKYEIFKKRNRFLWKAYVSLTSQSSLWDNMIKISLGSIVY